MMTTTTTMMMMTAMMIMIAERGYSPAQLRNILDSLHTIYIYYIYYIYYTRKALASLRATRETRVAEPGNRAHQERGNVCSAVGGNEGLRCFEAIGRVELEVYLQLRIYLRLPPALFGPCGVNIFWLNVARCINVKELHRIQIAVGVLVFQASRSSTQKRSGGCSFALPKTKFDAKKAHE